MNGEQQDFLHELHQHFVHKDQTRQTGAEEPNLSPQVLPQKCASQFAIEDAEEGHSEPKRRTDTASTKNNDSYWGAVRSLTQLTLEEALRDWLESPVDKYESMFPASEAPLWLQIQQNTAQSEILLIHTHRIKTLEGEQALKRVSWLFLVLMVGDMEKEFFGKGPMTRSRKKEMTKMLLEGWETMSPATSSVLGSKARKDVCDDAVSIIVMGSRLVWLCDRFGTGCLFWLRTTLTSHL